MKVSTIICGYNQARFAHQAVASVLAQQPAPSEVLFVDNGSEDDTRAVVTAFGAAVDYHRQPNLGPSAARNFGLARATGDFVHFLDADDWIEPGFYAATFGRAAAGDTVEVWVGGERAVTPAGTEIYCKSAPAGLADPNAYLFAHTPWCIHAALVRREAARDIGGFDVALWQCEDWDFWLRLAGSGARFASVDGARAVYRRVPGSNSTNYRRVIDSARKTLEQNLARSARRAGFAPIAAAFLRDFRSALWQQQVQPELVHLVQQRQLGRAVRLVGATWRADPASWRNATRFFFASARTFIRRRVPGRTTRPFSS